MNKKKKINNLNREIESMTEAILQLQATVIELFYIAENLEDKIVALEEHTKINRKYWKRNGTSNKNLY